nr:TraR/DksA C4-type zinc finger protein [Sulfobacillus harzensis]
MRGVIRERFAESETESVHALSAYDNHPADLATDTFHRELDVGLTVGLNRRLGQIDRAEEKLDEGTYGICDRCGRPIGQARLDAMPDAIYCVNCQREMVAGYQGPPSEAEVVPFPFGDRRDIHRDVVEPDGEDIWQSVAQWGNSDTPSDTPPAIDYQETFVSFFEPVGYVQDVESIVDENGDVLYDALRQKAIRGGDSTDAESDQYPD